ncbi:gamma-glutamyltransferase family protein [Bacillus massiliigorillae]|uniref:gamma-glutamyltransferase family protein n=1 Tax=Bacillus massiliigorillae TaxID=1243664 RepID=UPI0003A05BC0|nr:gamma-glutamyltransferase [Bacillus massiliigorillae]
MMKKKIVLVVVILLSLLVIGVVVIQKVDQQKGGKLFKVFNGFESSKTIEENKSYGVSSSNKLAVEVGMEVLEAGGNAVDAAVAVSYALGVVEPYGSGIGGGGGMLIVPKNKEDATFFDYRETSPQSSQANESTIGMPGFVRGMETVHEKFGSMQLADLLAPSVKLAEEGFIVDNTLVKRLSKAQFRLPIEKLATFFPEGKVLEAGTNLKQQELATTLKNLQRNGAEVFYESFIENQIVKNVSGIQQEDIRNYEVVERKPVYGKFLDYNVVSAPPPFSGTTLIQSLMMAELMNIEAPTNNSADYIHKIGQITNRTYMDRLKYNGDPKFYKFNNQKMLEPSYIEQMLKDMSNDDYSKSNDFSEAFQDEEHVSTTHFVVTDKDGTVVSVTNTLSNFFGSGNYVNGFFLNNSLSNFSTYKKSINYHEPGKKSRTFTAPTVLWNEEKTIGIGSPGGRRIPLMITEVLLRHLMFNESLQDSINQPRFFVEDNMVYTEKELSYDEIKELYKHNYEVTLKNSPEFFGGVQALVIDYKNHEIYGAADARRSGTWKVQ